MPLFKADRIMGHTEYIDGSRLIPEAKFFLIYLLHSQVLEVSYKELDHDFNLAEGSAQRAIKQLREFGFADCRQVPYIFFGSRPVVLSPDHRSYLWIVSDAPGAAYHFQFDPATFYDKDSPDPKTMSYAEYLLSDHWQATRLRALGRGKWRCALCNAQEKLQVHHRTYERLGCEAMEDLTVLCGPCHEHHHKRIARPLD